MFNARIFNDTQPTKPDEANVTDLPDAEEEKDDPNLQSEPHSRSSQPMIINYPYDECLVLDAVAVGVYITCPAGHAQLVPPNVGSTEYDS